ncbi:hypothetical protein ABH940_005426 [Streptacidiphilus sp. BW17]|uniref:hypothetical protein n=1 Tax=Streptacidiphilus sp. BW17 TaxID=3156274 RepID=UPI003510DEBE
MTAPGPESPLARDLSALGWSGRDLGRAVNQQLLAMAHATVNETTPCKWLTDNHVPRDPEVRQATATVLTQALGQPRSPAQLWPETPTDAPADDHWRGLLAARPGPALLDPGRRLATRATATPPAKSGPELFTAAWDKSSGSPDPWQPPTQGAEWVTEPMLAMLDSHLAQLRRLDDQVGGGPLSLRSVRRGLEDVLDILQFGRYTRPAQLALIRNASGLAQLAGWMSFDAAKSGGAQQFHLLSIGLAHAGEDAAQISNNLGMLAYQAAAEHNAQDALRLATAAVEHASRLAPSVRARAQGRLATACAVAGNQAGFQAATDTCRTLLDQPRREDDPAALYYLTPAQLDAETGHALVDLATTSTRPNRHLLHQAIAQLAPLVEAGLTDPDDATSRRSAVLHGLHLTRAYALLKEREQTVATAALLAKNIPTVQSLRCRDLLTSVRRSIIRQLPPDLAAGLGRAMM